MRKRYVALSEHASKNGVKVVICGSMNPAGERLKHMTGVAAILRFALPNIDDDDDGEGSDDGGSDDDSSTSRSDY